MLFSRLAVGFVAFSLVGAAVEKRQFGDMNSILQTLGKSANQIAAQMRK
jgi:hypothetical protein